MLIRLAEYAEKLGKHPEYIRQMAAAGRLKTATKIRGNWYIDSEEPWQDKRVKYEINATTGKRYGKLVVLKEYKEGKWPMCTCQCDCGKVVEVRRDSLISGNTTSCGCSRHEDLTGQRFGKLTALSYEGYKSRAALWRCRCDCDKEIVTLASRLKSGNTRSCGCAVDVTKTLQDRVEGTRLGSISPSRKARGTSGVKGVSWNRRRKKWEAYIQFKGHLYHLGLYDTLDAATEVRRNAEEKYFAPLLEKHKKGSGSP